MALNVPLPHAEVQGDMGIGDVGTEGTREGKGCGRQKDLHGEVRGCGHGGDMGEWKEGDMGGDAREHREKTLSQKGVQAASLGSPGP